MTTEVSNTTEGQSYKSNKNANNNYAAIRQKLTKAGLNLADAQQSSFSSNFINQNNQTPSKNRKKNKFKVSLKFIF